jgi:hypothetical protein
MDTQTRVLTTRLAARLMARSDNATRAHIPRQYETDINLSWVRGGHGGALAILATAQGAH